jgi:hypothetical protein
MLLQPDDVAPPCLDKGCRHEDRCQAMNTIEDAIRTAGVTIEQLVRAVVRDELRRHLGPEADHFINVKDAPMKASKLRQLVRAGELRGYKHGRDVLVSASDFRAFIQGHPVEPPRPIPAHEPPRPPPNQDLADDLSVTLGIVPKDPLERRAFEARLAQRRAEGGARAASLRHAEEEGRRMEDDERRKKERAEKRAAKKTQRQP